MEDGNSLLNVCTVDFLDDRFSSLMPSICGQVCSLARTPPCSLVMDGASSAGTGVELFSLMADSHKRRPELFSLTKLLRASAYNQGPAAAATIKLTSGPGYGCPGAREPALLVPVMESMVTMARVM